MIVFQRRAVEQLIELPGAMREKCAGTGPNASSYFMTGFRGSLIGGGGVPNQAVSCAAGDVMPASVRAMPRKASRMRAILTAKGAGENVSSVGKALLRVLESSQPT